eukprot:7807817-Prorocentrum_lima.AAC.1
MCIRDRRWTLQCLRQGQGAVKQASKGQVPPRQETKFGQRALENEVSSGALAAVMWAWKCSRTNNSRRHVVPGTLGGAHLQRHVGVWFATARA